MKDGGSDLVVPVVGAAISMGAAALSATRRTAIALAGAEGLVQELMKASWNAWNRRYDRRAEKFWRKLVEQCGWSPEDVRAQIDGKLPDEYVHATVMESVRGLLEALDDAVIPALAALAAEYLSARKRPDGFLRGMSRLLSELSAAEFGVFRDLIALLSGAPSLSPLRHGSATVLEVHEVVEKGAPRIRLRDYPPKADGNYESRDTDLGPSPGPRVQYLFARMKAYSLGLDNYSGYVSVASGPNIVLFERTDVARMQKILG